jgi:hypothetical protein
VVLIFDFSCQKVSVKFTMAVCNTFCLLLA